MDYEKKYKEALERARVLMDEGRVDVEKGTTTCEYIFPELKESKDEKIRKEIISYIKSSGAVTNSNWIAWLEKQVDNNSRSPEEISKLIGRSIALSLINYINNNRYEGAMDLSSMECEDLEKSVLASDWGKVYRYMRKKLEKQSEQKETLCDKCRRWQPSHSCQYISELGRCALEHQSKQKTNDKIEPKFHEGEWVVQGCNILKILCVGNEYYCFETVGGYRDDMLISEIDSLYHLWNIRDAKDGDVLINHNNENIFIFKGLLDHNHPNCPVAYCGIDDEDEFMISPGDYFWEDSNVKPSTKEQRDLFFQKMKEAGYEWDSENKVLKKI